MTQGFDRTFAWRTRAVSLAGMLLLQWASMSWAQVAPDGCDLGLWRNVTQRDYRLSRGSSLLLDVESNHFPPHVEALIRGVTVSSPIGGELNYTLSVYPNHHRALVSLMRLGDKLQTDRPKGTQFTVDCYFRRAVHFVPDDPLVRMIYAQYLHKHGRRDEALNKLTFAKVEAKDSAFTHYNIGLLYLEIGDHELALEQAWKASAMGFPRQDLKQALQRAGKWREAPP